MSSDYAWILAHIQSIYLLINFCWS